MDFGSVFLGAHDYRRLVGRLHHAASEIGHTLRSDAADSSIVFRFDVEAVAFIRLYYFKPVCIVGSDFSMILYQIFTDAVYFLCSDI